MPCKVFARPLRTLFGLVSRATTTGKHYWVLAIRSWLSHVARTWRGCASPCRMVNVRMSTAGACICVVCESAAARMGSKYRWMIAELTLGERKMIVWSWFARAFTDPDSANPSVLPTSSSISTFCVDDFFDTKVVRSAKIIDKRVLRVRPFSFCREACFSASETRNSCIILSKRPRASSSDEEKMSSMIRDDVSAVSSAGCALNKKPIESLNIV